jgi:hypothetical protein
MLASDFLVEGGFFMKRIASGLVVAAALVAFAGPAMAQPSLDFHFSFPTFNCTAIGTTVTGCSGLNPNNAGGMGQVMIVLGGLSGGAGAVQYGISYTTAAPSISQMCNAAYQSISLPGPNGGYPSNGSGVAIAFGSCVLPATADALIGVSFLFWGVAPAAGTISYIPDPGEGALKYVDCDDLTVNIDGGNTGIGSFGPSGGTNSCDGPVPTEEKSWGQIKSLF